MIVPHGHHENHTFLKRLLHSTQATLLKEISAILGLSDPILAVVICDVIVLIAVDGVIRVLNGLTILRVELLHLCKLTVVCAIICDELGGNLHWLA